MSRKHFNDFASEVKAMTDRKAAQLTADLIITVALRHNPNFDPSRFFAACGL